MDKIRKRTERNPFIASSGRSSLVENAARWHRGEYR